MCSEYEVDVGKSAQQGVAFLLRHAAPHSQHASRLGGLPFPKHSQFAVEPMLGLVPNRAGVDDREVGPFGVRRGDQTGVAQQVGHFLRVVDVHLTAVGAQQKAARRAQARLAQNGPLRAVAWVEARRARFSRETRTLPERWARRQGSSRIHVIAREPGINN